MFLHDLFLLGKVRLGVVAEKTQVSHKFLARLARYTVSMQLVDPPDQFLVLRIHARDPCLHARRVPPDDARGFGIA